MNVRSTESQQQRRTVYGFSRRYYVLFFLALAAAPTLYLIFFLGRAEADVAGRVNTSLYEHLRLYEHIVLSLWSQCFYVLPNSIGQYLLGVRGDFNQLDIWACESVLWQLVMALVCLFDVSANAELSILNKMAWSAFILAGAAWALPVPMFIYWFQYMWHEPITH